MYIYLPIAEISMHIAVVIGLGGGVGFLSGMFGVGGGFLMTPLLIFLGVPSAVAVSTEAIKLLPHLYQGCWPIGGEVTLISKWAAFF